MGYAFTHRSGWQGAELGLPSFRSATPPREAIVRARQFLAACNAGYIQLQITTKRPMRNSRPRFHLITRLLATIAMLAVCLFTAPTTTFADDEMSIEQAAKLIKYHQMFSDLQTIKLNTGVIQAKPSDVEHYEPKYGAFKSMGLIELNSITIESSDKDPKKTTEATRVSLTERGLKESTSWAKEKENEWTVTIAERRLVEIIKVHKDGDGLIHGIEFSWTWAANTIGEGLKFTYPTERAYAKLVRDGEDWRIVSIRALG